MRIILLLTLFLSTFAQADKLIVGGVSHHYMRAIDNQCGFNEVHPAIGLERQGYEVGAYKNSIEKTSFFIAKIEQPYHKFGLDFGYRVGVASGYDGKVTCESTAINKPTEYYDNHKTPLGLRPQASLLISKETKYITIDLGLSLVSTVIFKVNL
jgi:hypothetical protein